jgi:hypothetical protein
MNVCVFNNTGKIIQPTGRRDEELISGHQCFKEIILKIHNLAHITRERARKTHFHFIFAYCKF